MSVERGWLRVSSRLGSRVIKAEWRASSPTDRVRCSWCSTTLGDAGEHVVDPESSDAHSRGFVLSNGQVDDYPVRDTVGLEMAFDALRVLIDTGNRSDDHVWVIDR